MRNRPTDFTAAFVGLRSILQRQAGSLSVTEDSEDRFCLEGRSGPAAIAAWGVKVRKARMTVAWVEIGKAYVSYHLMPVYGNTKLLEGMSRELKARMQGKSCFNFKSNDDALFAELEQITIAGLKAFKKAGY